MLVSDVPSHTVANRIARPNFSTTSSQEIKDLYRKKSLHVSGTKEELVKVLQDHSEKLH